jgi:large subunit ribosomal protein L21
VARLRARVGPNSRLAASLGEREFLVVYAIIQSGGRQLRVSPGVTVEVDHFSAAAGDEVSVTNVLFVSTDAGEIVAGTPFVSGAKVVAVVEGESRGPKIRVFKKKRRKGMRRTRGHRSVFTLLRVKEILV